MERRFRVNPPPLGAVTVEAMESLRGLPADGEAPLLLGYHPAFFTNPYQALLYGSVREHAIAPVALRRLEQLDELQALQAAGIATVLHLHWLHLVAKDETSERGAKRAATAFLDRLDDYVDSGGRLVWTVHNILPHDARFEEVEAWLAGEVARRAEVVHVMAPSTADHVKPHYELPRDRLIVVPHPSYRGAYADHMSRLDARHELGLLADDLVAAVVGVIRPYKGIDELLDAWQLLDPAMRARLVIAGAPAEGSGIEALVERASIDPAVVIDARKLDADELQLYLRAADIAILPYLRSLNSGALLLALTFGLPVIVPQGSGLEEAVDPSFARTFRPGDPASLLTALRAMPELATQEARAASSRAAAALDPAELSHGFASKLRAMLADPAVAGEPAGSPVLRSAAARS